MKASEKNLIVASVLVIIAVSPLIVFADLPAYKFPSIDLGFLWSWHTIFWIIGFIGIIFLINAIGHLIKEKQEEEKTGWYK